MFQKAKVNLGVAFPEARQTVEACGPSGPTYASVARAGTENRPMITPTQTLNNNVVEEVHF